jgi:hypothetical protein
MSTIHPWQLLVLGVAGWINRHQQDAIDYLVDENHILKGQLRGKRLRLTDNERRRLAVKGKAIGRCVLEKRSRPSSRPTPLWRGIAGSSLANGTTARGERTSDAHESKPRSRASSSAWHDRTRDGDTRGLRGALAHLGHEVSRGTIANILKENGIEPAYERSKRTPWRTFLKAHWETLAAARMSIIITRSAPNVSLNVSMRYIIDPVSNLAMRPMSGEVGQFGKRCSPASGGRGLGEVDHDRISPSRERGPSTADQVKGLPEGAHQQGQARRLAAAPAVSLILAQRVRPRREPTQRPTECLETFGVPCPGSLQAPESLGCCGTSARRTRSASSLHPAFLTLRTRYRTELPLRGEKFGLAQQPLEVPEDVLLVDVG